MHLAFSLLVPGLSGAGEGAEPMAGQAARLHDLADMVSVRDVLSHSGIDDVAGVGDTEVTPETTLRTNRHLRPVLRAGRLVLPVLPGPDGSLVPFEVAARPPAAPPTREPRPEAAAVGQDRRVRSCSAAPGPGRG